MFCFFTFAISSLEESIIYPDQFFDIIKDYPIENTSDPKAKLFRVDLANTMANIGKMVSGSYNSMSYLQPAKGVMLDFNNIQNLNSYPDNLLQ